MKLILKKTWLILIAGLILLTTACMNNSGDSGSGSDSGSGDSATGVKVAMNPNLTAIRSQELAFRLQNEAIAFSVTGALGTMQVTDTSDSTVTVYDWPVAYDDTTFTLVSNKTIVLKPGIYDFSFLVTINNHQYAGSSIAVTINDGDQANIAMTVNAVIGDTNISVAVVAELPLFKLSYPPAELAGIALPKIGIIIDAGSETILDLNATTGISDQYVNLSEGAHTIEMQLYDGNTQVGKSIDAQESVTVTAGVNIPLDLVPLSGQAAMTLLVAGGDAVFNFTIPNEVIAEAGGAANLDTIFKMSGTANNPADVALLTLIDEGNGTSSISHTHTGMQAESVNLSLEFYDNTDSELLGFCTMTNVSLNVSGSTVSCGIELKRRAVIQGNILATIGVNVFDTDYNPIAGATISENGNTLGLTDSGTFGTPGFLVFNLQAGTYTIQAENSIMQGTATITVNALDVTNITIMLDTPLNSGSSITINSFSGAGVSADGTWSRCSDQPGADEYEFHTISGTSLIVANAFRSSTDGSCTGSSTTDYSYSLTLAADIDVTMLGWSDRNTTSFVAPPTALDGTTAVDLTPDYSGLSITGDFIGYHTMFIDDTGTPQRLYRAVDEPVSLCGTPNGNYNEPCALTNDFLTKE